MWVVSTFPLTLALLRALEMHSRGYLFASCLQLSNNLLIKEDWKHSTSDLAAWGLQGPCRPQRSSPTPGLPRELLGHSGQSGLPGEEVGVAAVMA